ncbi:MAG: acyl-CoA synthetase [Sphingomonadales bacterium]|nr:MAG: acyl-CoA synthetase [Sphingomonadales bacterium]
MNERALLQNLSIMLRRSAERNGDRLAVLCGEVSLSYRALDEMVDRLSRGLLDRGVVRGDRVAVIARNSHCFLVLRFAVARIGAVFVPVNFMLTASEANYILEHAGARLLFVDAASAELGRQARPAAVEATIGLAGERLPPPEDLPSWETLLVEGEPVDDVAAASDLLQIIYTSGTESLPKGAMLTHGAVLWQYQSCVADCEWTPDTVAVHAMPLFHCAQLDAMMGPALQVGACNIVTDLPTADNLIPMIARHAANSFFAPATIWIAMLRSPLFEQHDLSCLAKGYYGASIMPVEILRELMERLPTLRLWNAYGQTEIAPLALVLRPEDQRTRAGSAGRPVLNVQTRVVDDDMRDVVPGDIGEIVHRSPQLMTGYWNDPERTEAAFTGGWFHSGDLAVRDQDGYITIVDRKKDMIKTGGENVASREVEEVLYQHPDVSEVAVIGVPDSRWIEAVTAVVVLRQGRRPGAEALIAHCRSALASFKVPKRMIFADSLPKNPSGKIMKRDVRTQVLMILRRDS